MILPTTSPVNTEIFNDALKKVFLKLLKRKSPIVDDTCLQKLLDTLHIFVYDIVSVNSSGAVEFLKSVKDDPNIGNATLIFATQVAGRLVQNQEIFAHFEKVFLEFYGAIFESAFWQESLSLKTATFHSLKQTMQHTPGFLGIIHRFPDLSKEAFNAIQEESSIFLTKEAGNLIASLIVRCSDVQAEPDDQRFISDLQHTLLDKCWDSICSPGTSGLFTNHNPFLEPLFLLLCDAEAKCKIVLPWMAKKDDVLQVILRIIINAKSSELWMQAINVYLHLLHKENPGTSGLFTNHNPFLEPLFLLLCDAEAKCKIVLPWMAKKDDILQVILRIIINAKSSELWMQAINVYLHLLHKENVVMNQEEKMADILNKLDNKEQRKKLQTFIMKFLKRYSNEELEEKLIQLFCQPLYDINKYIADKFSDLPVDQKTKEIQFSPIECEKIICHNLDCWMEIIETDKIKKDRIVTASRSTSNLLLDIFGILAAKNKLQTSRNYLFLNTLATSNRLLIKILQYFCKLEDFGCQEEYQLKLNCVVKLLRSSLLIIEDVEQTSSVVSHAFQSLLCYLPFVLSHVSEENSTTAPNCDADDSDCDAKPHLNWSDNPDITAANITTITANVVTCSLCHPQWEIRDTTVEFLAKIFASSAVSPMLLAWIKKHKLHNSVYSSFSDGESYVRATAISAVTTCLQTNDLWSDFLSASKKCLGDILEDFIQVLQTDTEAFPRRAAAKFLLESYKKNLLDPSQKLLIYKTFTNVLDSDLDWEVKILAVNFWENVVSTEVVSETSLPAYAIGLPTFSKNKCQACKLCSLLKKFEILSRIGCTDSLLTGYRDCDHSVRERAGHVLSKLVFSDRQKDVDFITKRTCAKSDAAEEGADLFNCCAGNCCRNRERDSSKHVGSVFLKTLSEVGLEEEDLNGSKTFCDLYAQNPLSLIEDILADSEESEDEDKIVDCY